MTRRNHRVIAIAAFVVAALGPAAAHAQVDEARKTNWDNAKKLYFEIVDAVGANNRDLAFSRTDELRANLDYIEDKLNRAGERLHEKDRAWLPTTKKVEAIDRLKRVRVAAGTLGSKIKEVGSSPSSELSNFQSEWKSFGDSFDQLWIEYNAHGTELLDILKGFREDCRECK